MRRLTLVRFTLFGIAAALVAVTITSTLSAQERPTKVVYVDSQAALMAHPSGAAVESLRAQAEVDIKELTDGLDALDAKAATGQQLSPDEADRYRTLQTTLQAVQTRYVNDINEAAGPAVADVNAVIAELAQVNGYTLVLDGMEARSLRLVVYADPDLDITPLVIEKLENR